MNRFTNQGKIHFPKNKLFRPARRHKKTSGDIQIKTCVCPNGHSLIDENTWFEGHPGIKIKVKRNGLDEGFLVLSPKFGDYTKISVDVNLKKGDILEMSCPECGVELPVYSECYVCHNQMLTLFISDERSYSDCVGICSRMGCHNSKMVGNKRMLYSVAK